MKTKVTIWVKQETDPNPIRSEVQDHCYVVVKTQNTTVVKIGTYVRDVELNDWIRLSGWTVNIS